MFSKRGTRHLAVALVLAISLVAVNTSPVAALNISDYFEINYEPVSFVDANGNPKTEIQGDEVFYAEIRGSANCIEDLPSLYNLVSEARVTSRVVAEHQVNGTGETLNSSYTVVTKPFPIRKGDETEIYQLVSLQFPEGSQSGDYNVIGELTEAEAKAGIVWIDVTSYLPSSQGMGSVTYTASTANNPPNRPSMPAGAGSGYTGTWYSYSTSASDPDGGQARYTFDWGDGSSSETGFVDSGRTASGSHSWNNPGTYQVKAKATDSEGAVSGWSNSKVLTISAPPQERETHIAGIDMKLKSGGFWSLKHTYATATVTVVDAENNPVVNAQVLGHWTGATSDSDSAITGSNGKAAFSSNSVWRVPNGTTFTSTVHDVTKSGWTYDSDVSLETSDSVTVDSGRLGRFVSDILLILVKQFIQIARSVLSWAIGG